MQYEAKNMKAAAAERALQTISEVVRHMSYYVAPWQDVDLEHEAALAVRSAIGTTDSPVFHQILEEDPIFASMVKEAFKSSEPSKLIQIAADFDSSRDSQFAATVKVTLRSLANAARLEDQAFAA